jgi:hypothetical protein
MRCGMETIAKSRRSKLCVSAGFSQIRAFATDAVLPDRLANISQISGPG